MVRLTSNARNVRDSQNRRIDADDVERAVANLHARRGEVFTIRTL
jgi:hypothetical protein